MAEGVFRTFYAKLLKVLPMKTIVIEFYSRNLLPGDHKANIEALDTQKQKAEYFLDYVIKPGIEVGYTGQFDEMLKVMEISDDPAVKFVVGEIKGCSNNESTRDLQQNSESIGEYHHITKRMCSQASVLPTLTYISCSQII